MSQTARADLFGPQEQDDPRNALLDAFEAQVQALLDNGFELQVRTRLERLLPPRSSRLAGAQQSASEIPQETLLESHANFLLGLASMRKTSTHAKRLNDIAAALASLASTKGD